MMCDAFFLPSGTVIESNTNAIGVNFSVGPRTNYIDPLVGNVANAGTAAGAFQPLALICNIRHALQY